MKELKECVFVIVIFLLRNICMFVESFVFRLTYCLDPAIPGTRHARVVNFKEQFKETHIVNRPTVHSQLKLNSRMLA